MIAGSNLNKLDDLGSWQTIGILYSLQYFSKKFVHFSIQA